MKTQTTDDDAGQTLAPAAATAAPSPTEPQARQDQNSLATVEPLESAACHRHRVMMLRMSITKQINPRQTALNRCVIETIRNPVLARAVARGLRLHHLEKL